MNLPTTTMSQYAGVLLALLFAQGSAFSQSQMAELAKRRAARAATQEENLLRYDAAFDIYEGLAAMELIQLQADSAHRLPLDVFESGVRCASLSGQLEGARNLLDSLLDSGQGLERHWMRRIELALLMNSRADAELWLEKSEGFMSDSMSSHALSLIARSVQLDSTFTRASINRFRPSSDNPEFGAVPYGQSVVFVSASIGSGYASKVDGWSGRRYTELRHVPERDSSEQPVLLGQKMRRSDVYMASLAGGWHNGPVTFSKDESWMVVTQSHSAQGAHDTAGCKAQNLKLSFFQQNGADNWEDVTRQVFAFNDSTHSVCHAALDTANNLVFSSDRPGGFGNMDLWRSAWNGATFDPPVNLGAGYNTAGNDLFPFFNHNNQLHFSSNGHGGYGGLDVLREHIEGTGLEILGRPVNSTSDDFAIHLDSQGKGFISSNREGDTDHIYEIELEEVKARWVIALKNCSDDPVVGLSTKLMDSQGQLVEAITSDSAGIVRFSGRTNTRYQLVFEGSPRHRAFKIALSAAREGTWTRVHQVDLATDENELMVLLPEGAPPTMPVSLQFKHTSQDSIPAQAETDREGSFRWTNEVYSSYDSLEITLLGYKTTSIPMPKRLACGIPTQDTVVLTRLVDINLDLILYDLDKWNLRPESKTVLDKVVQYMQLEPQLKMELSSHTDSRESNTYNLELSRKRAQSCVDYLVAQGISKKRLIAVGYGETRLVNGCSDGVRCSEAQHQANRRTEFRRVD